jgi:hypothetical protein
LCGCNYVVRRLKWSPDLWRTLENAVRIEAEFKDLNKDRSVTISPRPAIFAVLKEQIVGKNLGERKLRKLAWTIASMPEKDL